MLSWPARPASRCTCAAWYASEVTIAWNDLELLINYTLQRDKIEMRQNLENAELEVARVAAKRRGQPLDENMIAAQEQKVVALFDGQADAFYTSGHMLDHGMIDPRDTRKVLGFCLDTCREARGRTLQPNSFGVARM